MPKRKKTKQRPADWCITTNDMTIEERKTMTEKLLNEIVTRTKLSLGTKRINNHISDALREDNEQIQKKIEALKTELEMAHPEWNEIKMLTVGMLDGCVESRKCHIESAMGYKSIILKKDEELETILINLKDEFDRDPRGYIDKYPTHCEMYGIERWCRETHDMPY